jgi:predicted ATPase
MITSLRIKNFKSWQDTKDIRLAPITLFFGVNSAGKTSLLQFLLMLKQTAGSPDRRRVLNLGDYSSAVELGTFEDLIYGHDSKRALEFEISWSLPDEPMLLVDPISKAEFSGDAVKFSARIVSQDQIQRVDRLEYELQEDGKIAASVAFARSKAKPKEYDLNSDHYTFKRIQGRPGRLPPPTRFYGFPDEVAFSFQNANITTDLTFALEQQLQRLMYLGPLRDVPRRSYPWAGDAPEHVGNAGRDTINALLAAAKRKISITKHGTRKHGVAFQQLIADWLKRLGLLASFDARLIAAKRKEYEVRVRTPNSTQEVDLPDVGFGISQVLPVVVESFYVPPYSTVIIEQPELHLHPKVQAELADLFIDAIHSRQDKVDRSIQFVIESHSEHFLQRLQLRIAEGEIKPEEVAIYFCEAGENGSSLRALEINLLGEISNWPPDFFGDPMKDLYRRMEAAEQRIQELQQA